MALALIDMLRKKHGADFHPAMLLAEVISEASNDLKLRVDCAKTLMPYVEATKKAIEIKGKVDSNIGLLRIGVVGGQVPSAMLPHIIENEVEEEEPV